MSGPDADVCLGLDLATAEARLLAVTAGGEVVAERAAPLAPVDTPAPGRREQRPVYLEVAGELLRAVIADLGPHARRIKAIATTGTSGTVVPVDGAGRPAGTAILYSDQRAETEAARLRATGRTATATSPLARMGWLRAHAPAARYAFAPDVVNAGLLGGPAPSDTSHALKAGIDPITARWDADALAVLGLGLGDVPPLVHPGTVLGEVDPAVAAELGLAAGVAVVAGMTDGCTAQIAAGAVEPGDTVGVLGTTLVWKAVSDVEVTGFDGALYSHLAPDGRWWPGGASNVGAAAVRAEFHATGPDRLARLEQLAAAHGPAGAVRYPLPGPGERFPFARAAARGFQIGETPTEAAAYRTLLEGVAFVERLGLDTLAARGVRISRHHLAGGASRSTLWNRIRATVVDVPVVRPRRTGSGYGAAVLALAASTGRGLTEAVVSTRGEAEPVAPLAGERERLLDGYARLREALAERGYLEPAPTGRRQAPRSERSTTEPNRPPRAVDLNNESAAGPARWGA